VYNCNTKNWDSLKLMVVWRS